MQDKKSYFSNIMQKFYAHYNVYTDTALADRMRVSRSAVAQWRYKKTIPKKILSMHDEIISGIKEEKPKKDVKIAKEIQSDIDVNYLVSLQKDKINAVEKELVDKTNQLEYIKGSPLQEKLWSDLTPDFTTEVLIKPKMKWFMMGMMIKQDKLTNIKSLSDALEMKEEKLIDCFSPDTWYEWGKSPVEKIMVNDSKDYINNNIPTLENMINVIKNLVGDHYYNQTVVYRYKNKVAVTHCASKIKWWEKPKRVLTKNTIIDTKTLD